MRSVVTGGSGFIGTHVVEYLREAGHDVLNVDLIGAGATLVDVCDTPALTRAFVEFGAQFVFHIAAVADARGAMNDPVRTAHVNVAGTAGVLEAARQAKVARVVIASTCWVANAMGEGVLDESATFLPTGGGHIYTTTKIASELLAHDYKQLYGVNFTILRYGIPYGPGMWPGLVLRNWLDSAAAGKPLTIFGDGSASRRFVAVQDLARAHLLVTRDVAANQTYNLEGMRFVTIRELADIFCRLWSLEAGEGVKAVFTEEASRAGEFQYFRKLISSHKAYMELGWEPELELEEGVRRTIEWYRNEVLHPGPTASS